MGFTYANKGVHEWDLGERNEFIAFARVFRSCTLDKNRPIVCKSAELVKCGVWRYFCLVTRKVPVEMSRLAKLLWLSLVSWNSLWKQRQQIFKSHRKKVFLTILHFAHSCGVVFWEIQLFGKSSFYSIPDFHFPNCQQVFTRVSLKLCTLREEERKSLPLELFFGFYPVSSFLYL